MGHEPLRNLSLVHAYRCIMMNQFIPVPYKGSHLRASWGAAVANGMNAFASMCPAGMLARDGVTGFGSQPLPKNLRECLYTDELHPWKVVGVEDEDHTLVLGGGTIEGHNFEIYVPALAFSFPPLSNPIEGIVSIPNRQYWYKLEDETGISASTTTLYVVLYLKSVSGAFDLYAKVTTSPSSIQEMANVKGIYTIFPIADVKIEEISSTLSAGKVVLQRQKTDIVISEVFYL